jgi:hypothetical protein
MLCFPLRSCLAQARATILSPAREMEWLRCSVRGCPRFCDVVYNTHPDPWCCKPCYVFDGLRHDTACACMPYEAGHILTSDVEDGDDTEDDGETSAASGESTMVGDSSHEDDPDDSSH